MMLSRRQFVRTTSLAAAAVVLPFAPRARRDDTGFTALRRGAGLYTARGGTIGWVATPDALVVVDTQFPDTAEAFWTGIQERSRRGIDLLVNTHHHGDHTAGNAVLRPHAQHLVAHRNVPGLQQQAYERAKADGREAATPITASETYDDTWSRDVGGETVRLRYYGPAHTGGDSVVHFEHADVAHMGDLVFNRLPPFIDRAGGASVRGWIDLLERVHADFAGETVFVFGHGNDAHGGVTGTRADVLVMRDFLSALLEHVTTGVAAGKAVDELAAIEHVPGFPDHTNPEWRDALPNAVRTVYAEVTAQG